MEVVQEDLDRIARFCDRACRAAERAEVLLRPEDSCHRSDIAEAKRKAGNALALVIRAGAARPRETCRSPAVPPELLNTAATRRLLDALRYALECAQQVDMERGWTLADGTSCGLAETIGDIAARIRRESREAE